MCSQLGIKLRSGLGWVCVCVCACVCGWGYVCMCMWGACVCVCVRSSNPVDALLGQWCVMSETGGFSLQTYAACCLSVSLPVYRPANSLAESSAANLSNGFI